MFISLCVFDGNNLRFVGLWLCVCLCFDLGISVCGVFHYKTYVESYNCVLRYLFFVLDLPRIKISCFLLFLPHSNYAQNAP